MLIIAAAVLYFARSPAPAPTTSPAPAVQHGRPPTAVTGGERAPPVGEPGTVETVAGEASAAAVEEPEPENVRRIVADQVVATVNGVGIFGKDLVPFSVGEGPTRKALSPELFDYLLQRAINRELVVQAARAEGVELADAQQQQLEQLRARLEKKDPAVVVPARVDPAKVDFEVRDAAGLLLQAALLQKAGYAPPYVTEGQVRAYYEEHRDRFGELPEEAAERQAAWGKIDFEIRKELAPAAQAEYREQVRQYLERIREAAKIDVYPPVL